ncbi:zinc finger and BTB domain-containing protein 24-like [Chironomus tepperi]|uniref:zinc finger and BTB domain-containing protein 24-like n=1 Tax=Chironomus tepperi TaxID=113505 RepID=UPI00391EE42D
MSSNNCRFCYSSTTKLISSISDEIVKKFIEYVPDIVITTESKYPSSICQLCYGKAKLSFDFIQKILEVQNKFKGTRSPRRTQSSLKIVSTKSLSTSEALEKVQKVGTISIKKVSAINQTIQPQQAKDEDLLDEMQDDHDEHDDHEEVYDVDGSSDEEFQVEKSESDEDEEFLEDDEDLSDDNYEPTTRKKGGTGNTSRSSTSGTAKKKKAVVAPKDRNSSNTSFDSKEIIIEAPIAFSCAKCREKFPSFEALTDHMKSRVCHSEQSICKECGKTFMTKKSLYNHMASHRPKEKYMCEVCAKEYNHQFDLEAHMESAHQRVVKRDCVYRCTHCNEKFHSHLDLLDHVKEHQREKKEASRLCEICAKVCANLKAYQSHIIIHKEKKAHTCAVCGKGFSKLFLYQQHMHVHTGIKAFSCEICNRSYAKRDSLRNHKKRDHPEVN